MVRLGYLVPEFPSQTHAFFWRESRVLAESGFQVTYLSTRRPPRSACAHAFAATAHETTRYLFPPTAGDVAALARHPRKTANAIRYLAGLAGLSARERAQLFALLPCASRLVRQARELSLDHIHVHSCANAAHLAALTQHLGGPSYSLTLHGDLDVYGTHHAEKMQNAMFVSPVTRPLQQELITRFSRTTENTPVILMGVDTDRFVDSGIRQSQKNQLRLLTVSRLNQAKGHIHAFAAMEQLRADGIAVTYTLAGAGPYEASLREEVARLGLQDQVRFLGSVSEDQVLNLLQESDAFILPSTGAGEASPVAVMEAMSCKLPVVCSLIGGTGDMIDNGMDGFLVPQKDVGAIYRALKDLATNLALRKTMGEAARARAETQFDHRKNALRLASAIKRGLATK